MLQGTLVVIESQGFYMIVSRQSCLPQHQSQPMPTAMEIIADFSEKRQVFLVHKPIRRLHPAS